MKKLKKISAKDLLQMKSCYDASKYMGDSSLTILDMLNTNAPFKDIVWAVCHKDLVSKKFARKFAAFAAEQVLNSLHVKDQRLVNAVAVAKRMGDGDPGVSESDLHQANQDVMVLVAQAKVSGNEKYFHCVSACYYATDYWASNAAYNASEHAISFFAEAQNAAIKIQKEKLKKMIIEGAETGDVALE